MGNGDLPEVNDTSRETSDRREDEAALSRDVWSDAEQFRNINKRPSSETELDLGGLNLSGDIYSSPKQPLPADEIGPAVTQPEPHAEVEIGQPIIEREPHVEVEIGQEADGWHQYDNGVKHDGPPDQISIANDGTLTLSTTDGDVLIWHPNGETTSKFASTAQK